MTTNTLARVRDLPEIWDLTVEQDWLVDNFLPTCSVIMLSGESGSGKSTVSLALADAVASGEPFLGFATKKKPVLIIDRENGLYIYHERLKRLGIKKNPDLLFWGHWSPWEPAGPAEGPILAFVQEEKPLIIFDSFVAFLEEGSEQDATDIRGYMDGFRRLAGMGATVLLIHHTGKSENSKDYRGSSDIKASIDVGLTLTAKKKYLQLLQLRPFKNREGIMDTIQMSLEGEKFQLVDSEYIESTDPGWKAVEEALRTNPGINQSQVIKLLPNIPFQRVRKILLAGEMKGAFEVTKGLKNASFYKLNNNDGRTNWISLSLKQSIEEKSSNTEDWSL